MPTWAQVLIVSLGIPWAGWVSVTLIRAQIQIVKLRRDVKAEVKDRTKECDDRLEWLRCMDTKLSDVRENTATILGYLEGRKSP